MSRSFKTEPARKAERQRRDARRSKRVMQETHTSKERATPSHMVKK